MLFITLLFGPGIPQSDGPVEYKVPMTAVTVDTEIPQALELEFITWTESF